MFFLVYKNLNKLRTLIELNILEKENSRTLVLVRAPAHVSTHIDHCVWLPLVVGPCCFAT